MKRKLFHLTIVLFIIAVNLNAQEDPEFTTRLMRSTYKIVGKDGNLGTGLLLFRPLDASPNLGFPILITAKHVLDSIQGDSVFIKLRKFENETFSTFPYWLKIRDHGKNLYTTHPSEDVAVMEVGQIPRKIDTSFLEIIFLANDQMFEEAGINPGTELSILGYPYGIGYNEGFPILRGGKIASYPLLPSKKYKTYLVDFEVFGGNSGGIVYYSFHGWKSKSGTTSPVGYNYIIGLVIEQVLKPKNVKQDENVFGKDRRVVIGVVLNSSYIIETINLLPKR